jgi:hypothetical protein
MMRGARDVAHWQICSLIPGLGVKLSAIVLVRYWHKADIPTAVWDVRFWK